MQTANPVPDRAEDITPQQNTEIMTQVANALADLIPNLATKLNIAPISAMVAASDVLTLSLLQLDRIAGSHWVDTGLTLAVLKTEPATPASAIRIQAATQKRRRAFERLAQAIDLLALPAQGRA